MTEESVELRGPSKCGIEKLAHVTNKVSSKSVSVGPTPRVSIWQRMTDSVSVKNLIVPKRFPRTQARRHNPLDTLHR
jgi:hypothetical protein